MYKDVMVTYIIIYVINGFCTCCVAYEAEHFKFAQTLVIWIRFDIRNIT